MPVTEIGDPRLQALFGANDPRDAGVRPTVRLPGRGLPPLALAGIALVLGLLLFLVLNGRRTAQVEPTVQARAADRTAAWSNPPPLYIPPAPAPAVVPAQPVPGQPRALQPVVMPVTAPVSRPAAPSVFYSPPAMPPMIAPPPPAPPPRVSAGPPLVIDTGAAPSAPSGGRASAAPPPVSAMPGGSRMRAGALANRSTTVAQGTIIHAVLETGFDSTKPGFARAVVSRDVRSFDQKNVLIPRGSRLIGEYGSEADSTQARAIITWTRLIRPDGMTIALDSPAVDTLGRGGVRARVNTHFFQRLGNALLQSTVELGRTLAGRSATPVVVVPGNAAGAVPQLAPQNDSKPTLTVAPGKSISVFVAHDLDFSSAGHDR